MKRVTMTGEARLAVKVKGLGFLWMIVLLSVSSLAAADFRLADAVEKGDREAARSLLAQEVDVNAPQADGATALAWAVHWDDHETADLLIRADADVNAANDYGITPLSLACTNRSAAMVEKLLLAGADPNAAQPTGETVLMRCAHTGSVDAVKFLIEHGTDVNAAENWEGQTALMWAVAEKHSDVAQALIEHGADVGAHTKGDFTPLLFATQQGDLDSARILLEAGADVSEATPEEGSALLVASASGHQELALFLLDRDADPNATNGSGYTALHYATLRRNMLDLVEALLARGANLNARLTRHRARAGGITMIGATPLLLAAEAGNTAAMRALVEAGADPLLKTKENTTLLQVALGAGQFGERSEGQLQQYHETAQLAVEMGLDVNAAGEHGWTAMHAAAYAGADEIIRFLADQGADLDVMDRFGQTPLSIAAAIITAGMADYADPRPRRYRKSTVDLLLQLGATSLEESGVQSLGSLAVSKE